MSLDKAELDQLAAAVADIVMDRLRLGELTDLVIGRLCPELEVKAAVDRAIEKVRADSTRYGVTPSRDAADRLGRVESKVDRLMKAWAEGKLT